MKRFVALNRRHSCILTKALKLALSLNVFAFAGLLGEESLIPGYPDFPYDRDGVSRPVSSVQGSVDSLSGTADEIYKQVSLL